MSKIMKIYQQPEECPFCRTFSVYHMIVLGETGPTRGCNKCHAMWTPEETLLHFCKGEQGEICSTCGKRVKWCEKHDTPLVWNGSLTAIGMGLWVCPKCSLTATVPSNDTGKVGTTKPLS